MKLMIDNLDGKGLQDYTAAIDMSQLPQLRRKLNVRTELELSLVSSGEDFVVPARGARVRFGRSNGKEMFYGQVSSDVKHEYLGFGEKGPVYRYTFVAFSDEASLDQKPVPALPPFVNRGAGEALQWVTDTLLPNAFDTSGIQAGDNVPWYACRSGSRWSDVAADLSILARANYRLENEAISFSPLGSSVLAIDESTENGASLSLQRGDHSLNDITVLGRIEPSMYVKDYFVGDGFSLKFYLSQVPFTRSSRTLVDEEFSGLDATRWVVNDPLSVVGASGGKLTVTGGNGVDGATRIEFHESMELGGALVLQHGDVEFGGPSSGILGGLYSEEISASGCLAGFLVTPIGSSSQIQPLINGRVSGTDIFTQSGHHYVLTTRIYASEVYRAAQRFHSIAHPWGAGRGAADPTADARIVLEIHDMNPADPATVVGTSTVLYDDIVSNVPGFCRYSLVNAMDMQCSIAFTRITQAMDALVRSCASGQIFRTRLTGSLADGGECRLTEEPSLYFYPSNVPDPNELIHVSYRSRSRARARVMDPVSIVAHRHGSDDGVRGAVRQVLLPSPRTSADCEHAALALLDDATSNSWQGRYQIWNSALPGDAEDVFPGDAVQVNAESQGANFEAIVREVQIRVRDLEEEAAAYTIRFADEAAEPLSFVFGNDLGAAPQDLIASEKSSIGQTFLPSLPFAEITKVSSTAVTVDVGTDPQADGGIEVRRTDAGWGLTNDRNLIGRFESRSFSVDRFARTQDWYLRQYDAAGRYSRYSTALHLDYPL
ncbi:MAG TPA: hypothetical protein VHR84_06910 [Terriglobales bacterium]|jgi:hypothetical protein|nr:hypothetical protein [Terriglobales bacterium]